MDNQKCNYPLFFYANNFLEKVYLPFDAFYNGPLAGLKEFLRERIKFDIKEWH